MNTLRINLPYVIFLGDIQDSMLAKTGLGLVKWSKDQVVGQLRLPGCKVDLGVADLTLQSAVAQGAKSLVLGVATVGGSISDAWLPVLVQALESGLDIVNGLHTDLNKIPALAAAKAKGGSQIVNVRGAHQALPVGTGRKRQGMRILTVGTDCAVGKKYTALAMAQCLNANGIAATFRATGQTGIMIAGEGLAVDSVISDFVSGAAELISPDNDSGHWDVVEGQGSLFNPSFSAVSMGLLHGSQPDALILCHDAARLKVSTCPTYAIPTLQECMDLHLRCAKIVNPSARFIGVSINTSSLPAAERKAYLDQLQLELGLPCVDPLVEGCQLFVEQLQQQKTAGM